MPAWEGIVLLAQRSGIPYRVTSTYRPGDPLNHGRNGGQAVDFGGYNQDRLAGYFMRLDTLEVIHRSQKTGIVYGSSMNRPYAPGSNAQLLREHENHVHVAMDQARVSKALKATAPQPPAIPTIKKAVTMLVRQKGKAATYFTDGLTRRWVKTPGEVAVLQGAMSQAGLYWQIIEVASVASFGTLVGTDPGNI